MASFTRRCLPPLVTLGALLAVQACRPPSPAPPLAAAPPAAPPAAPTPEVATTPLARPSPSAPGGFEGTLSPISWPGERHLANVRQLTFGGENAEAYWSADGSRLIFQSTRDPHRCDQIFVLDVDRPGPDSLVSSGKGRTTCPYFYPDGSGILYSSTFLGGAECPTPPDRSKGYVWGLFADYDVFRARPDGSGLVRLTSAPGYDAEATISRGGRIVFTSVRDGDLELYSMAGDGTDVRRLTHTPGYDGGAFFSDDGEWIVYRASRPAEGAELLEFRTLLSQALVRPSKLEIHVMRADGSQDRQVTSNGAANFAPYFFPGTHEKVVFVSNLADRRGRDFDLYAISWDGTGLERLTFNPTFDGFPMFSPDGRRIAFCSNRHNAKAGDTNVFVADWVP